jgi:hypothetical protein
MAFADHLKAVSQSVTKALDHPTGQHIAAHLINRLLDNIEVYIKKHLKRQHKHTSLFVAQTGHLHLLNMIESNT